MRVTERHGITALTLEAAAEEAGLTKPGLMYHFRTRDELLMAIQRYLVGEWEQYLLTELGKPLEESTVQERAAAYARVNASGPASKAELAFMVESASSPSWRRCGTTRWRAAPRAAGARSDAAGPRQRAGRRRPVAVEATRPPLAPEVKEALIRRIAAPPSHRPDVPAQPVSTRKP